jgi:hypothetical protein
MQSESFAGAQRRVIIGSITKQSSTKRIVFPVQMPLGENSLGSLPDWVSEGYAAVAKQFTEVDPQVQQIAGLSVAFWNDTPENGMFAAPNVKVPDAELRGFVVKRVGEEDDPDIELQFKVYCAFNRELWAWLGEMAGEEVQMAFPSSVGADKAAAKSAPDNQMPLEHPTPAGPKVVPPKKSGPKELAAFHEKLLAKQETLKPS